MFPINLLVVSLSSSCFERSVTALWFLIRAVTAVSRMVDDLFMLL